jgi:hypothetical protein
VSATKQFNTPRAVHRSLLKLYLIFWACVVLHLHGVMHREVWPHGPVPRLMCAVPPISPIVWVTWGRGQEAALSILFTLIAAALWVVAVRHPPEPFLRVMARVAIVLYWLVLWFPMALGA